jgi:hypothetical protein
MSQRLFLTQGSSSICVDLLSPRDLVPFDEEQRTLLHKSIGVSEVVLVVEVGAFCWLFLLESCADQLKKSKTYSPSVDGLQLIGLEYM